MKYPKKQVFGMLRLFGDFAPHKYYEQHQLFLLQYMHEVKRDKINIKKLLQYCWDNAWVTGVGEDFNRTIFPFRYFMLTRKGDEFFRILSIEHGGSYSHYKYFDREKAKGRK